MGGDIFFVISGYLMTGIITGKLLAEPSHKGAAAANRFSIIDFYLARARRILPALIVLCLFLLVVGWFYLSARDYKMLGTHVISALTFISNIIFWDEAGYFDTASHEKLLLHTWSLSVEWQFYIIFPVVLVVLWKLIPNRRFMGLMLVAGFLASLSVSVIMTPKTPAAAFYLLPTRAWEMLAGGLVYFYAQQRLPNPYWARGLELTGFGLIVLSLIFFDASTPWPGYHALAPTVGSVLVLLAARSTSVFTGTRPAQWLGKTSYSIYLWHWPLSVALIYLELTHHWVAISVSMVLTLMLGWASWAYVEQPAGRRLIRFKKLPQIAVTCGVVLLVAVPAAGVRLKEGVSGRLDPKVDAIFAERENDNPRKVECRVPRSTTAESCTYGGNELGIIVLGDSHAQSVVRSVQKALPYSNYYVADWTMNGCATIFDIKDVNNKLSPCRLFLGSALEQSKSLRHSAPLLIINRFSYYIQGPNEPDRVDEVRTPTRYISEPYLKRTDNFFVELQSGIVETACAFAQHRPVYMMRPIPEMKLDVPRTMGRAAIIWGQERRVSITLDEYEERHRIAWAAQDRAAEKCGVILLDPRPYLCSDGRCWGDADGLPLYTDDDHMSERGGQLLIPLFKQMFNTNDLPQVSQNQ
jgi:peptidoglycan/LPS O-acetylase OafA/YrhL